MIFFDEKKGKDKGKVPHLSQADHRLNTTGINAHMNVLCGLVINKKNHLPQVDFQRTHNKHFKQLIRHVRPLKLA